MIARTVCVARLSTTHSSLLDSTSLNRMYRGAADVYYFKLYANFHKPNSIFFSWQGYNQNLWRIRGARQENISLLCML